MPLNNFGIVGPPQLYRCAQPDSWGCSDLVQLGVTHLVTLNGWNDPLIGMTRILYDLPTFTVDLDQIRTIRDQIWGLLSSGATVAVHCTHGRDRTGLVIGAYSLRYGGANLDYVNQVREAYGVYGVIEIADQAINEALEELAKDGK